MRKQPTYGWVVFCCLFLRSFIAQGATTPSLELSTETASAFVKTIGLCMDNRSYQPATTLSGTVGMDIGIETTLVQPPSDLGTAFGSLSGGSSATTIPIIPSVKLSMHKGFGDRFEIGGSVLPTLPTFPYIGGSLLLGFDVKLVIYQPEEGATWAIRASYNYNNLTTTQSGMTLTIKTATITPQLLISKKLDFADPYMGIGLQYTWGSMSATIPLDGVVDAPVAIPPVVVEANGSGYGAFLFIGVAMRIPTVGFKLTLEGAYSPLGMNQLGTKISFGF